MESNTTIFISTSSFGRFSRRPIEMLEDHGIEYRLNPHGRKLRPEETPGLLDGVDGLIAGTERLDQDILGGTPGLRVISRCGTGLDSVDLAAARELGIRVYNTPDAHVDAVAELALGAMLNVLRRASYADRAVRDGEWTRPMGRLLRRKVVGIVGLGRVGKRLVRLLQPFEARVIAYDPERDEDFADRAGVSYASLDALVETADVVSLHLPYGEDVHHLFDHERLARMKEGAVLVNCARGGLVDEAALHGLLADGHLAGAHLDTFEEEPYDGPLRGLSNVLLTPHIGSYAAESRIAMEIEAADNLIRFFRDRGAR